MTCDVDYGFGALGLGLYFYSVTIDKETGTRKILHFIPDMPIKPKKNGKKETTASE